MFLSPLRGFDCEELVTVTGTGAPAYGLSPLTVLTLLSEILPSGVLDALYCPQLADVGHHRLAVMLEI